MFSPLPSPRLACAGLAACAGVLALSPGAGAATLKLPAPAAGEVAVVAAPVTGALKVGKAGVPKGVAITGGTVSAGGKKLALVAVIRPKKTAKPSAKASASKLGVAATGPAVLASAPAQALSSAVAPACSSAAATLGRTLRRGAGAPSASDLKTLGKVLAARLCGTDVDAKGTALLGLLGLNAAGAKAPTPGAKPPAAGTPAGVVGGASARPASPAPAPTGGGSTTTTPPPSTGDGSTNQCSNGKDDDGDGQVDALGTPAPLFDPGCSSPADTTEDSEKPLPAACTDGAVTQGSRVGFAVRVDSRTSAGCPKAMTKGLVDVPSKVTGCDNPGWDDGHGNGASSTKDDVCSNVVAGGIRNGDEWHLNGVAAADLCGARAVVVAYAGDGTAWERDAVIADKVAACTTPAPPLGAPECADGIDNDYDGQIDVAGVADSGPDPGCTSAQDASEDEATYPSTGCWNYVAPDPADATIAWLYVMPNSTYGSACPTMDAAAISFDYLHVTSCLTKPYWTGTAGGTCTVKNGDAWLAGGSGQRIAVALQLDEAIGCDAYVQGQIDMRAAGTWREAITTTATIVDDHLEECY